MAQPPDDDEEELVFNIEDVQKIVRDNIELCLGGNAYSHSRTPHWITIITDKTLTRLNKLNKPFKYILRITITQKNGSGLHTAAAYFWDTVTDGTCTVRWENKYMYCIVNVWASVYDGSKPFCTVVIRIDPQQPNFHLLGQQMAPHINFRITTD